MPGRRDKCPRHPTPTLTPTTNPPPPPRNAHGTRQAKPAACLYNRLQPAPVCCSARPPYLPYLPLSPRMRRRPHTSASTARRRLGRPRSSLAAASLRRGRLHRPRPRRPRPRRPRRLRGSARRNGRSLPPRGGTATPPPPPLSHPRAALGGWLRRSPPTPALGGWLPPLTAPVAGGAA